jgi:hypothetical protein
MGIAGDSRARIKLQSMSGVARPRGPTQEELNRRTYPRRRTTFPATYIGEANTQKPAFGLDISGGGLCLLTQEQLPPSLMKHLSLLAVVGEKKVRFECSGAWGVPIMVRGQKHFRYGMKMKQIADHDWNHVMDHSLDGEGGPGLTMGSILTAHQRDTILPIDKQHHLAEALSVKQRLAIGKDGRLPLVEYTFTGYAMQRGVPYYKLAVRSKVATSDHHVKEFKTNVLVAIEGDGVKVLD